ncbi:MAG TPA: AAA domain-containing protein [Longimicrobium sp.]|nr:AAA domain-containing protein [Longimicrobium sp.]
MPSLRLTGSLVAQYFRFACDRQLRYELVPPRERGADVPAANDDPAAGPLVGARPGLALLRGAGRRWERSALDRLIARHGDRVLTAGRTETGDARKLRYEDVVLALRSPGDFIYLVQPELRVTEPEAFAARHGFPAEIAIAPAQPDLVRIRRGADGRVRLGVGDIKWSREGTIQHFAQVAFYALLLEEVCRAEGIDAQVETRWGWLWTRGSRGLRRFALPAYRYHVEAFLRDDLPRIAAGQPVDAAWHLGIRCPDCAFYHHCRAEADGRDDLARVAGVSPLGKQVLLGKGLRTVASLGRTFRKDTYTGCHALESAETALRKRVQSLSFGKRFDVEKQTHLMGEGERVRVMVTAEADPVSGIVYALGMRAEGGGRSAGEVFIAERGTEQAEREMLHAFLARAATVAAQAAAAPREEGRPKRPEKPLHVYLWERAEGELLRDCLQRHLGDPATQPGIAGLARFLFPVGGGAAPPGTVVRDVVEELFALPVPYAWDLAAVSAALQPEEGAHVHRPADGYAWPLSSRIPYERIHQAWRRRPRAAEPAPAEVRGEIRRTLESKLAALDSVVRGVREQASLRGESRLRMDPGPLSGGDAGGPIADPALEQLRLFTLWEAAAESLAIRQLHALPTHDRARRFECIRGMELVEVLENGHAVFTFDEACREAKFRPGEFALVLTNDDGRTLVETDRKPWLRRKLGVELVEYDLAASPPRVVLASDHGWQKLEKDGLVNFNYQCVLDRSEADFNTRRLLETLRALGDGAGSAATVLGLLRGHPPAPPSPLDADAAWSEVIGSRDVLNAEQAEAWRAAFERTVSVVWGPPGTGKTYLLAWQLIGLAAAARRAHRPLRVLVTAGTHRAIVNVLATLARQLAESGIPSPLRAVKLEGRGSEADRDLEGLDVELVRDTRLPALLGGSDVDGVPLVAGSTVWSLWKQMRAMNGAAEEEASDGAPMLPLFDVVVIDEASQVRVPEALVALSSLRPGGRVIVCGDDRQLPPILRGRYPREETLFGSAFAHFAGLYGRFALRESRRMNRPLVRWPRRVFYPGFHSAEPNRRLRIGREGVDLSDPLDALLWDAFLRPGQPAVLCTYAGYRATARNPLEAMLVGRIARLARAGMRDPATGLPYTPEAFAARGLAVISPHRAQNSAILGELVAGGWPRNELPVVDTVERMQGNERELILVSYAVADREYAEREADFLLNPNRFNVSITRPRSKLIVFMSQDVLRALPRDEQVLTDSMAIKGYPAHFGAPAREIEVPAPDGQPVRMHLYTTSAPVPARGAA